MLRRIAILLVVLMLPVGWAWAADGAFRGSFPARKYLRVEPKPNTRILVTIPAGVVLDLEPVEGTSYARTQYGQEDGFVHLEGVTRLASTPEDVSVVQIVKEQAVEVYWAYARTALPLLDAPETDAEVVDTFPAETPILVLAKSGNYLRVEAGDGDGLAEEPRYARATRLQAIPADKEVTAHKAFLDAPQVLYERPLSGSNVLAVIPPPGWVTIQATNGLFARVETEAGVGYLLRAKLTDQPKQWGNSFFGTAKEAAPLYSAPSRASYTDQFLPKGSLVRVDEQTSTFLHLPDLSAYLPDGALERLTLQHIEPVTLYAPTDQPLYREASTHPSLLCATLPANQLVTAEYMSGSFYLVPGGDGTAWGFAPRNRLSTLPAPQAMDPRPATPKPGAELRAVPLLQAAPLADSEAILAKHPGLWLKGEAGGFYETALGGTRAYLLKDDVTLLAENVPVKSLEAYFDASTALLDFPSETLGWPSQIVPANSLVRVLYENGAMYGVLWEGVEGYIPKRSVVTQAGGAAGRYALRMDKSTRILTVYAANAAGERTDRVVREILCAIGRRGTPTPSGDFEMTSRERWHYFGPSYAPFAIAYAPGKYLHGPLYHSANENTVYRDHLDDFGKMATAGCLRMPYEDILWIYYHCGSGTMLEIVQGGAE
jgi:lipoprotein-anchoring transpeptidase ErfK/SrfK